MATWHVDANEGTTHRSSDPSPSPRSLPGVWHWASEGLASIAEAVNMFLSGVIYKPARVMSFIHLCTHTSGYSFLVDTDSSTSGRWMPTLAPLSLLEEEESRDFLEAKDTPLPCNLPPSSSLPVTS